MNKGPHLCQVVVVIVVVAYTEAFSSGVLKRLVDLCSHHGALGADEFTTLLHVFRTQLKQGLYLHFKYFHKISTYWKNRLLRTSKHLSMPMPYHQTFFILSAATFIDTVCARYLIMKAGAMDPHNRG
jgi:hypothetical protein